MSASHSQAPGPPPLKAFEPQAATAPGGPPAKRKRKPYERVARLYPGYEKFLILFLEHHGGLTHRDAQHLARRNESTTRRAVYALTLLGLVREDGTRKDSRNRANVTVWNLTQEGVAVAKAAATLAAYREARHVPKPSPEKTGDSQ